ncbi:MAG: hypothetical protein ACREQ5_24945, partial [Candidatus Dormibacteria bacterium]
YWWQRDQSGNTLGYSQLFLRPLEFGRLGELMMHNGAFQGVQLIDPSYMQELRSGSPANCGYGYMVWLNGCGGGAHQVNGSIFTRREISPAQPWIASAPSDMYYSWGYHGQHTFVIPSLDMIVTRSGERPADTNEDLTHADGDAVVSGTQKAGYFNFFKLLMAGVTDMPGSVRTATSNASYQDNPQLNVDPDTFIYPTTDPAGTYLDVGPSAPQGCTLAGCQGEKNDGLRWITDVPRTGPSVLGMDSRPNG